MSLSLSFSRHRLALTVVVRIGYLLIICFIFGALHLFAAPFPRRFFCTDQSLRYPTPAASTVPYAACAPVGVALAAFFIVWVEVLRPSYAGQRLTLRRQWRRQRWSTCLRWLYYFCLGCSATELLTITAKLTLGRHRPYFMEACRPDSEIADTRLCNSSVAYPVSVCRPIVSRYEFKDAQMSFPSGHTSYSLFVAVFVAGYLQLRLRDYPAARFCLQVYLLVAGLCVGYSRVSDYKHHWGDVLAGAALGAAVAAAALRTAVAASQASSSGAPTGNSATSVGEDIVVAADDVDEDAIISGPPRRRRLRDQAAIDAEAGVVDDSDAAAKDADRDSGNVEDEKTAVAGGAAFAAKLPDQVSNGVV